MGPLPRPSLPHCRDADALMLRRLNGLSPAGQVPPCPKELEPLDAVRRARGGGLSTVGERGFLRCTDKPATTGA